MQDRRLRLSGSEANTLLKLELLHKDIKARQQQHRGGAERRGVEGDDKAMVKLGSLLGALLA